MIVKFFRRSKERGSAPVNYLLGKNRDRLGARVVAGDPELTERLIDSVPFQNKYKCGVLSFAEQHDQITSQQKLDIMEGFEKTLFPGLEPDQANILWVEHTDKGGRLELNFLIPCMELRTGKRLQPYYAGVDKSRVNAWKNIINHDVKTIDGASLADPNEPNRSRLSNIYMGTAPTPYHQTFKHKETDSSELDIDNRNALRQSIDAYLQQQHERNELSNRDSVIDELENLGLTIERTTKNVITVSHPSVIDKNYKPQRVRLKGGLYRADYNPQKYTPQAQAQYQDNYRRPLVDKITYEKGMTLKAQENYRLFGDAIAPEPLPLNIQRIDAIQAIKIPHTEPSYRPKLR